MPAPAIPKATLFHDAKGFLRQVSYSWPYIFGQDYTFPDLESLAAHYLHYRQVSEDLGLYKETVVYDQDGVLQPPAITGIRFKEEKRMDNGAIITYEQTIFDLPIWRAAITVRIHAKQMSILGSLNTIHHDIEMQKPNSNNRFTALHLKDHAVPLCNAMGISNTEPFEISGIGELIYQYNPDNRFDFVADQELNSDLITLVTGNPSKDISWFLPLQLPDKIVPDRHYVVTELLFSLPWENGQRQNWRAFIEQETGAVLYLRSFVSCAKGDIMLHTHKKGNYTQSSDLTSLAKAIDTVTFDGINSPTPPLDLQGLNSQWVTLTGCAQPNHPMGPQVNDPYYFSYGIDTNEFAACNAYYHCDNFFRLVESLGFDPKTYFDGIDFPLSVDPNSPNDNAITSSNGKGKGVELLKFGVVSKTSTTTIGLAVDARVVAHEFGHAILRDHINSCFFGFAHSPGDSLAAILYDPESLASDRFKTFPFLDSIAGFERRHDRDAGNGWGWDGPMCDRDYNGEQVLSTMLFRVYRAAGGDSVHLSERHFASRYVVFLILKAIGLMNETSPYPETFIGALIHADQTTEVFEGHPGGTLKKIINWSFAMQHNPIRLPLLDISIHNNGQKDNGYLPYQDYHRCSNIWNRKEPDACDEHQRPSLGKDNYAYIRITNNGILDAANITVKGFQSSKSFPEYWPADWEPLSIPVLELSFLEARASAIVGPFRWKPGTDTDHILFSVSMPGDESHMDLDFSNGPIWTSRLVRWDNNIALRSFD